MMLEIGEEMTERATEVRRDGIQAFPFTEQSNDTVMVPQGSLR